MAGAAGSHLRGVGVEYACIMCLSMFCKKFNDFRINLVAVVLAGLYCHADAAVWLQGALKRLVCLKTNDGLLFFIQIARTMRGDGGNDLCIHIQHAALCTFLLGKVHDLGPEVLGILRWSLKEVVISVIGGVVLLDEVADIDLTLPHTGIKCVPFCSH